MDSKRSGIILSITSIETISACVSIMVWYKNKTKDFIYRWAIAGLILSFLSLIISWFAYFHIYIPYVYQLWAILFEFVTLILIVMAIFKYQSTNGFAIIGWILLVISNILTLSLQGNTVLPTIHSEEYRDYTRSG
jgi:hypothetical protein